jgi:CelD/BcsL family acetyltransferase involved in cellulose biosynthesis
MSSHEVAVLKSVSAVAGLCDAWEGLSAPFATPLLDHDWFLSAAESLHDEADLRVVVVRQAGRVTAVAPLALDASHRRLMLIGAAALYEPGGLLFASDESLQLLLTAIAGLGEAAVLQRLPARSAPARVFRDRLRTRGLTVVRETAPSYGVPTNRPWAEYVRSLSGRTRRRLDVLRARAMALAGSVELDEIVPTPVTVDALLDQLMATEHAGWKGRGGSSLTSRADLERFFRRYTRRVSARHQLRVTRLRIGDDIAAIEFAIQAHGRRWGLKLGYDERFAPCAPAIQVVHASIQAAFEQGLSTYEFLGSAESWQERWKPERRDYVTAVVYPFRLRALMTAVQDVTGALTRTLQPIRNVAV